MLDVILLLLALLFGTIGFIGIFLKWMTENKIYEKYKFILAMSIASVLSLLMAIVVEIEVYWNPESEIIGMGLFLLLILVIGWFIIFGFLAALLGMPSRGEERENGFSKFPVVLVPSVLVSIADVVIISAVISSPWFPMRKMLDVILLLLASLLGTIGFIVTILKWMTEDKIYEKYKFILAISIASVLSLLMAIVVEIKAHWNPESEIGIGYPESEIGMGFSLLLILVIGWFIIFGFLAALVGAPSRGEERENGFSKFPVVLVPSVLVSIADVVIIWTFISSNPWFPRVL